MGHSDGLHRRGFGLTAGREGLRSAAGLEMRAMAVEFPVVHGHPNRLPFEGVLTLVAAAIVGNAIYLAVSDPSQFRYLAVAIVILLLGLPVYAFWAAKNKGDAKV